MFNKTLLALSIIISLVVDQECANISITASVEQHQAMKNIHGKAMLNLECSWLPGKGEGLANLTWAKDGNVFYTYDFKNHSK